MKWLAFLLVFFSFNVFSSTCMERYVDIDAQKLKEMSGNQRRAYHRGSGNESLSFSSCRRILKDYKEQYRKNYLRPKRKLAWNSAFKTLLDYGREGLNLAAASGVKIGGVSLSNFMVGADRKTMERSIGSLSSKMGLINFLNKSKFLSSGSIGKNLEKLLDDYNIIRSEDGKFVLNPNAPAETSNPSSSNPDGFPVPGVIGGGSLPLISDLSGQIKNAAQKDGMPKGEIDKGLEGIEIEVNTDAALIVESFNDFIETDNQLLAVEEVEYSPENFLKMAKNLGRNITLFKGCTFSASKKNVDDAQKIFGVMNVLKDHERKSFRSVAQGCGLESFENRMMTVINSSGPGQMEEVGGLANQLNEMLDPQSNCGNLLKKNKGVGKLLTTSLMGAATQLLDSATFGLGSTGIKLVGTIFSGLFKKQSALEKFHQDQMNTAMMCSLEGYTYKSSCTPYLRNKHEREINHCRDQGIFSELANVLAVKTSLDEENKDIESFFQSGILASAPRVEVLQKALNKLSDKGVILNPVDLSKIASMSKQYRAIDSLDRFELVSDNAQLIRRATKQLQSIDSGRAKAIKSAVRSKENEVKNEIISRYEFNTADSLIVSQTGQALLGEIDDYAKEYIKKVNDPNAHNLYGKDIDVLLKSSCMLFAANTQKGAKMPSKCKEALGKEDRRIAGAEMGEYCQYIDDYKQGRSSSR